MIQGIRAGSDGEIDPDGRYGLSRGNEGMGELVGREAGDEPVKMLADEVYTMSEAIKGLEKLYETRDTTTTGSIEELLATLKTLSHNQTILENKLEDALKNQMNTDLLVNSLNSRMNQLSTTVAGLSKAASFGPATANRSDSSQSTVANGAEQSRPPSVRRGPGRPRKDGTSRFTDDSRVQVNPVKVSLPTGAVQVSKAKKYFVDPNAPPEPVTVVKSEPQEITDVKGSPAIPAKRKRGRPPKKRTVDTMLAGQKNAAKKGAKPKDEEVNVEEITRNQTPQGGDDAAVPPQPIETVLATAPASPSISMSPLIASRSSSPSSHIANLMPSTVATAETTDIPENENGQVGTLPTENPIITTRIIGPLARKKLLGATADSDNIMIEMSSSSVAAENNGLESISSLSRQQQELDKRRDAREKMLVNMKYNDREKAKSFMESNKKLLKAMREEERRKRMTALINGSSSVSPSEQPSPSVTPTGPIQASGLQPEEVLQRSKKIGISSILNNDGTTALIENPEVLLSRKRSHEADFQDFTDVEDDEEDDEDEAERYRKRMFSNQSPSPSAHLFENSPGFDKEGALSSRRGESQASLILASPIELLCRDGFFYQRDNPKVPITTGSYLDFKFRSKEEELIKLNDNHRDFVDKTRHERMNAHFLRLDIECETENAFAILSKTTLTEKYVNSLEYFLMEFRWENKLVGLGLKLRESKRTWQRRKALFTLFEFWRDQSRRKRNFRNYTILHAVKEMENYRIFINRSVSWFYNHITLLKMILYDLCDNVDTQWREWMFNRNEGLPTQGVNDVNDDNINEAIDNVLTLDFLDDGTQNNQIKSSKVIPPPQ